MIAASLFVLRIHPALGLVVLALYFLPTIIAAIRGHPQLVPILIVNFFLGWTFVGWVVALAWAAFRLPRRSG
jgi:hypothetical protein